MGTCHHRQDERGVCPGPRRTDARGTCHPSSRRQGGRWRWGGHRGSAPEDLIKVTAVILMTCVRHGSGVAWRLNQLSGGSPRHGCSCRRLLASNPRSYVSLRGFSAAIGEPPSWRAIACFDYQEMNIFFIGISGGMSLTTPAEDVANLSIWSFLMGRRTDRRLLQAPMRLATSLR